MYRFKLIILFITFSGLGFSQSVENYNLKKISFEKKYFIIDSVEWEKGNKEFYKEMKPISDAMFETLGLERQEPIMTYEELMDSTQKSSNESDKYSRYFIYETINDSIIKRYESTPEHPYASGPNYLNFKTGKVYGDFPYKHFHRAYEFEFEKVDNVILEEYRDSIKIIGGIECFKVKLNYTYLVKEMYKAQFPQEENDDDESFFQLFESMMKNQEIHMEMWVTDRIKSIYHPILKVKEVNEKYYPLEIERKSSNSEGKLYHYTLSELNF